MSPLFKYALLTITTITFIICSIWVMRQPSWVSITSTLFALTALLTVINDVVILELLGAFSRYVHDHEGRTFTNALRTRHKSRPISITNFQTSTETETDKHHVISVYLIRDSANSGLVKGVVHQAPGGDPYDIFTVEGTEPIVKVLDLDGDGEPELFVETVLGAHTHQVNIFRLSSLNRFFEVPGSPLISDWGPVKLTKADNSAFHLITILKGSGPAGINAQPYSYRLRSTGLEGTLTYTS